MKKLYTIPLIPLRGLTVFPKVVVHFDVGRKKSTAAIEQAMLDNQEIFLVGQKDLLVEEPTREEVYSIGVICKIKQILKMSENTIRVLVEGLERAKIVEYIEDDEYIKASVEKIRSKKSKSTELEAYIKLIDREFMKLLKLTDDGYSEVAKSIEPLESPIEYLDMVASYAITEEEAKQEVLECLDIIARAELILEKIKREVSVAKIQKDIASKVKSKVSKEQKEYYLREQLKAIQEELGEDDEEKNEIAKYEEKIEKLKIAKEIKEKLSYELGRLKNMNSSSAEANVIKTYLDWALDIPWGKYSKESIDIVKARDILNKEHYGLDDVKDRIIEYLAVKQVSKSQKGPILCLVGPPGVGKTSIARSIANAMNRKYTRISLGGMKDESEIRGHRRTYVGSIPGRIINGVKEAQTKNPVFLFDEIDKMAADYKGDPASAMLEVLDPEQNKDFVDHYLEIPFDLSKILFVTTANSLGNIPRPLLDRMEVIEVSGYIEEEKLNIAKKYLLPKQIKEHALKENFIKIDDETLRSIINHYTREAGVRTLERTIGKICRKVAKKYVEDPTLEEVVINKSDLETYLGKDMFKYQLAEVNPQIGLVNGLAWTEVGGVTLEVEVNVLKGKGEIVLTGKLGDVMKESAKTGISYIRSIVDKFDIDPEFYKTNDIHIHIPEGAVPKDGPSAGITMALAVISALTKRPVPGNIAMTGEITLRGRVLAVGGVKEKLLAAHRAGITKVLIPKECEADLDEIPENVKEKMEFVLVEHMDEVLEQALLKSGENNEN